MGMWGGVFCSNETMRDQKEWSKIYKHIQNRSMKKEQRARNVIRANIIHGLENVIWEKDDSLHDDITIHAPSNYTPSFYI